MILLYFERVEALLFGLWLSDCCCNMLYDAYLLVAEMAALCHREAIKYIDEFYCTMLVQVCVIRGLPFVCTYANECLRCVGKLLRQVCISMVVGVLFGLAVVTFSLL